MSVAVDDAYAENAVPQKKDAAADLLAGSSEPPLPNLGIPEAWLSQKSLIESAMSKDHYAGILMDSGGDTVILVPIGTDPKRVREEVASAVSRPLPSLKIRTVANSLATLESLRETGIWSPDVRLPDGAKIVGGQILPAENKLQVKVQGLTEAARQALMSHFGDAITVVSGSPAVFTSRFNDTSPYYSGDRWLSYDSVGDYEGECTTGFSATYNNRSVIVTAGHCAPYGNVTTPTNTAVGRAPGEQGCNSSTPCLADDPSRSFGTVYQTRFKTFDTRSKASAAATSVDLAMLTGNPSTSTWAVKSNSAVKKVTTYPGSARNPEGFTACQSGATSFGSNCGVVESIATEVVELEADGGEWAKIDYYPVSGVRTCEGDSGGPVVMNDSKGTGYSVLGVVSLGIDGASGSINEQECFSGLGFTFWGQGVSEFPKYHPVIS